MTNRAADIAALNRDAQAHRAAVDAKILSLLPRFAKGEPISELRKIVPEFAQYLCHTGLVNKPSCTAFLARNKESVPAMMEAVRRRAEVLERQLMDRVSPRLSALSNAFSDPALSMREIGRKANVSMDDLRQVLTESGLTDLGQRILSEQTESVQREIEIKLKLRTDRTGIEGRVTGQEPAREPGANAAVHPIVQPMTPASPLSEVPSQFSLRDLEGHFESTASQPQTPASHLSEVPSQFSLRDLEGHFESTASQPQTPAVLVQDGVSGPINDRSPEIAGVDNYPSLQGTVPSTVNNSQSRMQAPSSAQAQREAGPPQPSSIARVEHTVDRMQAFARVSQAATLFPDDAKILSLLPRYAEGEDVASLRRECPSLSFYLSDVGLSDTKVATDFLSRLTQQQRGDLRNAIEKRIKNLLIPGPEGPELKRQLLAKLEDQFSVQSHDGIQLSFPDDAKVLSLLPRYAAGEKVSSLRGECRSFSAYLTERGLARNPSGSYFFGRLNRQQRDDVQNAIKLREIFHRLVDITAAFAQSSNDLESVARKTKVSVEHLRQVLTESGLTELGRQMHSNQPGSHGRAVAENLRIRVGTAQEAARPALPESSVGLGTNAPVHPVAVRSTTPLVSIPDGVVGRVHEPLPEIVDVDNYPSPPAKATRPSAAQRLANDSWLRDVDFVNFTQMLAQRLRGLPNAGLLHFVDPQQVRALVENNVQLRNDVLHRLTRPGEPPILFLPVNHDNQHWSLLVVNRQNGAALHYDSMPWPAHLATNNPQSGMASRVAIALGVRPPVEMPMAKQRDGHSCGDHVLTGIEELAERIVRGEANRPASMNLHTIRPDRAYIVNVLTQVEQFDDAGRAEPAPQRPHDPVQPEAKRRKYG